MADPVRVMVEMGPKRKRFAASAFDWPGWDRGARTEDDAFRVLAAYRARYAPVAVLAGHGEAFEATGDLAIIERIEGIGMTDFYGLSMRPAGPETEPISDAELERKIALLRASWTYFDATAARVSAQLRLGPRGGGRDRDKIVRHVNGAEIDEFAKKVGVVRPLGIRDDPAAMREYRDDFVAAIRETNALG
ncbi:MAG: hypothetical protein ACJ77C_10540, partial [Chloroflexota bacterium]